MTVAVQLEAAPSPLPEVEYRWNEDTDILTARLHGVSAGAGMSGTVELEGADGSWLVLDVAGGCIDGVEVAVWPDVRKRPALLPPVAEDARVVVSGTPGAPGIASLEVETLVLAEADAAERVIHFRLGAPRIARTIRVGCDLLLDLDPECRLAGLWLLNVPPFPSP